MTKNAKNKSAKLRVLHDDLRSWYLIFHLIVSDDVLLVRCDRTYWLGINLLCCCKVSIFANNYHTWLIQRSWLWWYSSKIKIKFLFFFYTGLTYRHLVKFQDLPPCLENWFSPKRASEKLGTCSFAIDMKKIYRDQRWW